MGDKDPLDNEKTGSTSKKSRKQRDHDPEEPRMQIEPDPKKPRLQIEHNHDEPRMQIKPDHKKPQMLIEPDHEKLRMQIEQDPEEPRMPIEHDHDEPRMQIEPDHEKPRMQIEPDHEKPQMQIEPDHEKPRMQIEPDHEKPRKQIGHDPEEPRIQIEPDHEKPRIQIEPDHEKPRIQIEPDHEKPRIQIEPDHEKPRIQIEPDYEKPPIQIEPDHEKPRIQIEPDHEKPRMQIEPDHEKPRMQIEPDHDKPLMQIEPDHEKPQIQIEHDPASCSDSSISDRNVGVSDPLNNNQEVKCGEPVVYKGNTSKNGQSGPSHGNSEDSPNPESGDGDINANRVNVEEDLSTSNTEEQEELSSPSHDEQQGQVSSISHQILARLRGLRNHGTNCYINVLMQSLFMTPEFRDAVYSWGDNILTPDSFVSAFREVFDELKQSKDTAIDLKKLITTVTWFSKYEQQDLAELLFKVLDLFELSFGKTDQWTVIKNILEGCWVDYVECSTCQNFNSSSQKFIILPIDVEGPKGLYKNIVESLAAFIEPELLSGTNQYNCEKCDIKTDAHKGVVFSSLPPVLLLQLKQFDIHNLGFKLSHDIDFPLKLDLNDLMKKNNDILSKVSKDLIKPVNEDDYIYELYIVIVHVGSVGVGHYYVYIRSLETNKWYKFDDNFVHEVLDERQIFDRKLYSKARSPYVLGYRRVNKQEKVEIESAIQLLPTSQDSPVYEVDNEPQKPVHMDVTALVYWLKKDPLQRRKRVKVHSHGQLTIGKLKNMVLEKFGLSDKVMQHRNITSFRLVRYNPATKDKEMICDNDEQLISEHSDNPVFLLELFYDGEIDLTPMVFRNKAFKFYQIKNERVVYGATISVDIHCTTKNVVELLSRIVKENVRIIIDNKNYVMEIMPKDSSPILSYINMITSRYYIVGGNDLPKNDNLLWTETGNTIRRLRRSIHFILVTTGDLSKYQVDANVPADSQPNLLYPLIYSWATFTSDENPNPNLFGITAEGDISLKNLYYHIAKIINVRELFLELQFVNSVSSQVEMISYSIETLKDFVNTENVYNFYNSTFDIYAQVTENANVIVFFLNLQNESFLTNCIEFNIKLPCTIGDIKKEAIRIYSANESLHVTYDSSRLRRLNGQGVSTVFLDTQVVDKSMTTPSKAMCSLLYQFCLQTVPSGSILFSRAVDPLYLFIVHYDNFTKYIGKIEDFYVPDNSKEAFITAVTCKTGIPARNLYINVTHGSFPLLLNESTQLMGWVLLNHKDFDYAHYILSDGKVILYMDIEEKTWDEN